MRKTLLIGATLAIAGVWSAGAQAMVVDHDFDSYDADFVDMIDYWGVLNWDSVYIGENRPLEYTHDLTGVVDFDKYKVSEAYLELDFTNDVDDGHGSKFFGLIKWDFREYVEVAYDGSGWVDLSEVGNGQYDIKLGIDWLNDDGMLDVTIDVSNGLNTASAWLDHSKLYGKVAAVPEAGTLALFGLGLAGIGAVRRRRTAAA